MFATLAPPTELIELLTIFPALMMIFPLVERPGAIPFSAFKKWRHFINQSHFSGTGNPNGAAAASLGLSSLRIASHPQWVPHSALSYAHATRDFVDVPPTTTKDKE